MRHRRPHALAASFFLALLAPTGCAAHRGRACLSDTGCAKPPPLADCSQGGPTLALEDVLGSGSALLGQRILVRGPLTRGMFICSIVSCSSKARCNNGCAAFLELSLPHPCDPSNLEACSLDDWKHTLLLDGLTCLRDSPREDSRDDKVTTCCPFVPSGRSVVARGMLRENEGRTGFYHLVDASICGDQH